MQQGLTMYMCNVHDMWVIQMIVSVNFGDFGDLACLSVVTKVRECYPS